MEKNNEEKNGEESYEPNYLDQDKLYEKLMYTSFLLIYGTIAIFIDDLYIPRIRGKSDFHFHGIPLWIMYIAMLIGAAHSLSFVIDHHDLKNNEIKYKTFQRYSYYLGWSLALVGTIMQLKIDSN